MKQVLIAGGSPIYQAGLLRFFERCFPDSELTTLSSIRAKQPPLEFDLRIFILGNQPRLPEIDWLRRHLPKGRNLVLGDGLSMKAVKRLLVAGAGGFLRLIAATEYFEQAIADVLAGIPYVDPELKKVWVNQQLSHHPSLDPLTKRERQVLELIVGEYTTEEIAKKLFISHCTAETHRSHILQKLGVRNTAGVVREAIRRDLCQV